MFTLNFVQYRESEPGKGVEIPDDKLPKLKDEVDLARCKKIGLKLTGTDEKKLADSIKDKDKEEAKNDKPQKEEKSKAQN